MDAPKKVMIVPGEALPRSHRDHILDIGLWPQATPSLSKAVQVVQRNPNEWQTVIVDLSLVDQGPGINTAIAALRGLNPDLQFILLSAEPAADVQVGQSDMVMAWPLSLQQLEAALECHDHEYDEGYSH